MITGINSNQGIGTGEAIVYDNRGSVNYYLQQAQKQQLNRQKEQEELSNMLSTVKTDGLRNADQGVWKDGYEKVKELYYKASTAKDDKERLLYKTQVKTGLQELANLVNQSKQFGKQEADIASKMLDDRFRDQWSDDAVKAISTNRNLSILDANHLKDYTGLQRERDYSSVPKEIDSMLKGLFHGAKPKEIRTNINDAGKPGVKISYQKQLSDDAMLTGLATLYDANRPFRNYIRETYPELDEADGLKLFTQDLKKQQKHIESDKGSRTYAYKPNAPRGGGNEFLDFSDVASSGKDISFGVPNSNTQPQPRTYASKSVAIGIKTQPISSGRYINYATGKFEDITQQFVDADISSIQRVPVLKSQQSTRNGKIEAGSLATKDYATRNPEAVKWVDMAQMSMKDAAGDYTTYMIPANEIPKNVLADKKMQSAINTYRQTQERRPTSNKPQAKAPAKQTQKKKITGF